MRLWAISAYFNPTGSRRRLENYRAFRAALRVPLVTAELAYGPSPELGRGDADVLIGLRGDDVLWQKERLLNLALRALPPECEAVAWLDADIVFAREEWADSALEELGRAELVQPFSLVRDPDGARDRASLAKRVAAGELPVERIATAKFASEWRCAPGLAWVARRDLLTRHGLYDAAIVGGGDRGIVCAAYGAWEGLERMHRLNARQLDHYLAWARPFFASVQGRVGYVEGELTTLPHSSFDARAYAGRHAGLEPFGFDPATDVALDEQGCWRWASDRPGLHEYVRDYFRRRGD